MCVCCARSFTLFFTLPFRAYGSDVIFNVFLLWFELTYIPHLTSPSLSFFTYLLFTMIMKILTFLPFLLGVVAETTKPNTGDQTLGQSRHL
jgi:hypothetical protein